MNDTGREVTEQVRFGSGSGLSTSSSFARSAPYTALRYMVPVRLPVSPSFSS